MTDDSVRGDGTPLTLHLLGDLGLHLAEGGGLLFHLLETALHLVKLVQLQTEEGQYQR